ncbi:MAG: DNA alkylation repair protein [Clostridiales bacterium]|nr:DNA alkylation repair protein [Clostridiales bacterium]
MTRQGILDRIFGLQDTKYKKFHEGLVPGKDNIIGVRLPVLRGLAKELLKENSGTSKGLLEVIGDEYYEEVMLQGMIIGFQQKIDIENLYEQISNFVPKIDNWAICDSFCSSLKQIKKHKEGTYEYIQRYLKSDKEFEIRFGLVMLLEYYLDEEHLFDIFRISQGIDHEGYYVRMANAWLISICLVKYYDETKAFMEDCRLDDFTYNKALQKARESLRINSGEKEELNRMKRKK